MQKLASWIYKNIRTGTLDRWAIHKQGASMNQKEGGVGVTEHEFIKSIPEAITFDFEKLERKEITFDEIAQKYGYSNKNEHKTRLTLRNMYYEWLQYRECITCVQKDKSVYVNLQTEIEKLKVIIDQKDKEIDGLKASLYLKDKRIQETIEINNKIVSDLNEQRIEARNQCEKYAEKEFNRGIEIGIKEERKRRNPGRKKDPFLEEDYLSTAREVQKLLDMGHKMKEIIENRMITKVNPKTKQIEPVSRSTIYRCMKLYKNSTK